MIIKHTDYLRGQHDSYKTCIKKVRTQARKSETRRNAALGVASLMVSGNETSEMRGCAGATFHQSLFTSEMDEEDKKAVSPIKFTFATLDVFFLTLQNW